MNIAEINLKIEKSAEQNKIRINKMQKTNELVESLRGEAKKAMQERMQNNRAEYSALLKQLLVQGLIKLIEPKVTLRCRETDHDLL